MTVKLAARKYYLQPGKMIFGTLVDMMNLQGGREIFNGEDDDGCELKLQYGLVTDCLTWTLRFSVYDGDRSRCRVELVIEEELEPEDADEIEIQILENLILSQFALLDSLIVGDRYLRVSYDGRCG